MTTQGFRALLLGKRIVAVRLGDEDRPCPEEFGTASRDSVTLVLDDGTVVSPLDTHDGSVLAVTPPGREP